MIAAVFQTDDQPVRDRFEWWRELVLHSAVPAEHIFSGAGEFRASATQWRMGVAHVSLLSYSPLRTRRSRQLVRRLDPEGYRVVLNLDGTHQGFSFGRDQRVLGADELLVYDTSRPHDADIFGGRHGARMVLVDIPRSALSAPANKIERLLGVPLSADSGTGALLAHFLTGLVDQAPHYAPDQGARLGAVTTDLIAIHLSQYLDTSDVGVPGGRRQVLLTNVYAFIEEHLGDPDLTPSTIAAAHFISLRHLHQLFEGQAETPAAWIRRRRLLRCRSDLADPLLAGRPIGAIAARWGFRNPQDFSRAFRAAFGVAPREYRVEALMDAPRARTDKSRASIARDLLADPDESFR